MGQHQKGTLCTGQRLGQCTHLSPAAAGPWGPGAPSSTKTEKQKAPCQQCRAQRWLQVQTCCSGCGRMGPRRPRCSKSGLLSTACSPSLQNHRRFPCGGSGSRRSDVDIHGARQELAPAADLSGNGEGAPTAPAPARAAPTQCSPAVGMGNSGEGWSWESIYPFPSCFRSLSLKSRRNW